MAGYVVAGERVAGERIDVEAGVVTGPDSDAPPGTRARVGRRRTSTVLTVLPFVIAGVAALTLLALIGLAALRSSAVDEAARQAGDLAATQSRFVVEPALSDGLLAGDPVALHEFDVLMHDQLLHRPVVRIKLWQGDGRILYSDEPKLIGRQFSLSTGDLDTLRTGVQSAGLTDVDAEDNLLDTGGPLLQVYNRVTAPDGQLLLFEVYYQFESISRGAEGIGRAAAPAFLLALLALEAVQIPLAVRLVRRVRREQQAREAMHRAAMEACDNERRRIARDLHDGLVQSLAGVSMSLSVVGSRLEGVVPDDLVDHVRSASETTRAGVGELRTLVAEIYPPNLESDGLPVALADLAAVLRQHGITAELDLPDELPVATDVAAVLYRAAQECLRNVVTHSAATRCWVSLAWGGRRCSLVVRDDGRGFVPGQAGPDDGRPHFGLRLMTELVEESGGRVVVQSAPGAGATVYVEVPTS